MSCRRCLVSGALLSLCALTAPRVSAASDLDAALCGPPSAADEPEKLSRLQADMPPIADQSPAGWCYAFATTALINHYIHTVNGTPYDHAHMISPIDAVAAHRYYDDSNREASLSHPVGRIDLKHGGQAIDVLTGIQDQPAVRSLAQVGFTSTDSHKPDVKALKKAIREGTLEDLDGEDPDTVSHSIKTFRIVNPKIFDAALAQQDTDEAGRILDHYYDLAQKLFGDPDLKVPPFTAEYFSTRDPERFLRQIRETLAQGRPVELAVDASVALGPYKKKKKRLHAMVVVGAGYVGGVCTARLRNSWGMHSKRDTHGYRDLSVDTLLLAVGGHPKASGKAPHLVIEWMSPPRPDAAPAFVGKEQHLVGYEGGKSEFIGRSVKHQEGDRELRFSYVEGVRTESDGSRKYYAGGKVMRKEP